MTIKTQGKNISAENEKVVVGATFSSNGILTLNRKNFYNDATDTVVLSLHQTSLNYQVATLNDLDTIAEDETERGSYIFLVEDNGVYDQYVWVESEEDFVKLNASVDLSNYVTSNEVSDSISTHNINAYAHATKFNEKLDKALGSSYANSNLITDANGNITYDDLTNPSVPFDCISLGSGGTIKDEDDNILLNNSAEDELKIGILYDELYYDLTESKLIYSQKGSELATLDDIQNSDYVHPSTKQCNYSYTHPSTHDADMILFSQENNELWQQLLSSGDDTVQEVLDKLLTYMDGKPFRNEIYKVNIDILDSNGNQVLNDFNMAIDETYYIRVTIKDLNNNGKPGTVTLNVDKGYFDDTTPTQNYTIPFNGSTRAHINYVASDWGFVTFECEGTKVQSLVSGWKPIASVYSDRIKLYSDGKMGMVNFYYSDFNPTATSSANPFGKWVVGGATAGNGSTETKPLVKNTLFETYAPIKIVGTNYSYNTQTFGSWSINNSGHIYLKDYTGSSSSVTINSSVTYPLKNPQW